MGSSMLLYLINEENEIPQQPLPNTGYYIISKNEITGIPTICDIDIYNTNIDIIVIIRCFLTCA